ncbi:peptidase inhibitor family I36 protein [Micromonospora olivasterospora]|uniref:Peptidase inhibitor family I36 n=1 Tax=Micromonospora olivasterospora TaxID=1880 RepID=A0A562HU62_MICOL|nr:peptidase inhibitor family I36 protein [Micromonospora olivasterospora]TWH62307.1 peptidase inhibitor family I36 [Micromonospora olivasterospora]
MKTNSRAAAQEQPGVVDRVVPRDTSLASFQGRTIDLSKSWEGAQACAVLSRTEVRCYASREEEKADLASRATSIGVSRGTAGPIGTLDWNGCDEGWVCIYEHQNFGGRKLSFNDEFWHDLATWAFVDMTTSFTNNQGGGLFGCSGSDSGILGDGAGDNLTMTDCTASANLGTYNDRTEDIHG